MTIANANFCSYFGNRAPSYEPRLTRCTAYQSSSCCQPDEEDIGFDVDPIFHGEESAQCRNMVDQLRCWICHPQQNLFYQNEKLTVCEGMCDRLLGNCRGARWRDGQVGDYYKSGIEFCKEMGFSVSNTNCFTSAARRTAAFSSKLTSLVTIFAGLLLTGLLTKSSQLNVVILGIVVAIIVMANPSTAQTSTRASEVSRWANSVSVFINNLANEQLLVDEAQELFDNAEYNEIPVNGSEVVEQIRQRLSSFAADKTNALDKMAATIADEYNRFVDGNREQPYKYPEDLPRSIFRDADATEHLPYDELTFDRLVPI